MSLKAFHIIFITVSTLLAFGFGVWSLTNYFSAEGAALDLVLGAASLVAGVGLIIYGRYFLKKLKNVGYL
jgi:hypothetical protein